MDFEETLYENRNVQRHFPTILANMGSHLTKRAKYTFIWQVSCKNECFI